MKTFIRSSRPTCRLDYAMPLVLWIVVAWIACDVITLVGLGLVSLLMFDSSITEHYTRTQRIMMVVFGPITILIVIFVVLPPTRWLIWTVKEVLLEK